MAEQPDKSNLPSKEITPKEIWLSAGAVFALGVIASFLNPDGVRAFAVLLGVIAWPAVVLIVLAFFRLEIAKGIERVTEVDLFGLKAKLQSELKQAELEAEQARGPGKAPTEEQVERAVEVRQIVGNAPELVRSQVDQLAEEYQNIRTSMPPGDSRTRRMEIIVAKMRTIGLAAYSLRYELAQSPSPGRRLQAVACLQVKPDFDMLDWLADLPGVEKPFIGYHALVALNVAASSPMAELHQDALKKALHRVKTVSAAIGEDTDRRSALDDFERRVQGLVTRSTPSSVGSSADKPAQS